MELVALAGLLSQLIGLLLEQLERISLVDPLALRSRHAVADPLPELTAGNFGSSGILPVFYVLVSQPNASKNAIWRATVHSEGGRDGE